MLLFKVISSNYAQEFLNKKFISFLEFLYNKEQGNHRETFKIEEQSIIN